MSYKTRHKLQMFRARILPISFECKYIPGGCKICYTCLYIYPVVNMLHIVSAEAYVCHVCRSSTTTQLIHTFQITKLFNYNFQIINSSTYDIWELVQTCRTFLKLKLLFLNNRWTCLFVLGIFQETHSFRELSVMYLVHLILLSHLQLISPL